MSNKLLILEKNDGKQQITCAAEFRKDEYGDWYCVEAAPVVGWMVGTPPRRIKRWLENQSWRHYWHDAGSTPVYDASGPLHDDMALMKGMDPEIWEVRVPVEC